jgi:DNA-binding NarL/FixJ family response regulator
MRRRRGTHDRGIAQSLRLVAAPGARGANAAIGVRGGSDGAGVSEQRKLVADLCRLIGDRLGQPVMREVPAANPAPRTIDVPRLSPRLRQTLVGLLAGRAEKQIARDLSISRHTVHVYVKNLYKRFEVASRGELLAKFVNVQPVEASATGSGVA